MFASLIVLPLLTLLLLLYLFIKHKYSYWRKLGVKGPPPSIFKLGNFFDIQGESLLEVELTLREKYGSTYGTYTGLTPTLTITDPELIKQVLIKDFSLFTNRRQATTHSDLFHKMHVYAQDQYWKRIRKVVTPNFTTGRLRQISPLMNQCVDQLEQYFIQLSGSEEQMMKDTREVITGFTIQTIAATNFGAQTASIGDRSQVNPFVINGHKISKISAFQGMSYFVMPKWFNALFRVKHPFNGDAFDFFTSTTKGILRERQRTPDDGTQNSLVKLLFNASEKEASSNLKETLSDEEIIGVAVGIFLAGFDTTALTISSCLYELALAEDIQERLFEELESALAGLEVDSEAYYDTIMGPAIPYLEAVIKETLRKYPAIVRLERRCATNGYTLGSIPLVKDQLVEISTLAVHYSEALYPEPFSFKPSRFLPESKHQIVSGSFLPFGDGPRNCVGRRYAYQEIKLCLSRILRRFRFQVTPETPKQLRFVPFSFALNSQPIPLKVIQRKV